MDSPAPASPCKKPNLSSKYKTCSRPGGRPAGLCSTAPQWSDWQCRRAQATGWRLRYIHSLGAWEVGRVTNQGPVHLQVKGQGGLEYGFVPKGVLTDLQDIGNWKASGAHSWLGTHTVTGMLSPPTQHAYTHAVMHTHTHTLLSHTRHLLTHTHTDSLTLNTVTGHGHRLATKGPQWSHGQVQADSHPGQVHRLPYDSGGRPQLQGGHQQHGNPG